MSTEYTDSAADMSATADDVAGNGQEPAAEQTLKREKTQAKSSRQPSPAGQTVSGEPVDTVYLSRCVYKSKVTKKSLSVHHLQRRLAELGYHDAYTDEDGWYGDLTKLAVAAYQKDSGLPEDGVADADTLRSLFADDPNVEVDVEN